MTIVAILAGAVLVKQLFTGATARSPAPDTPSAATTTQAASTLARGQVLRLEGANWSARNKTYVLVLSTQCHFCSESAPFYRKLANAVAQAKTTQLLVAVPQPEDEGRTYVTGLGLNPALVIHTRLSSLGIKGTPTIVLVDQHGIVVNSWSGRLTPEREREVLSQFL